jgi:hypothetical protein
MATKIMLVTSGSIQVKREIDEVVSEINAALTEGSLVSVKGARGGVVWINRRRSSNRRDRQAAR